MPIWQIWNGVSYGCTSPTTYASKNLSYVLWPFYIFSFKFLVNFCLIFISFSCWIIYIVLFIFKPLYHIVHCRSFAVRTMVPPKLYSYHLFKSSLHVLLFPNFYCYVINNKKIYQINYKVFWFFLFLPLEYSPMKA